MSAGITITEGTFNPPAPLAEIQAAVAWPAAISGWLKKRPMQWHSLPQAAAQAPADDFDYSAMVVAPHHLWVEDLVGGEIWRGVRDIRMDLDWPDMPPSVTAVRVGYSTETPVANGSVEIGVAHGFFVQTHGAALPLVSLPVLEAEFTPYLHGQDYTASEAMSHGFAALTGRVGYSSPEDDIEFYRGDANSVTIKVLSGATILAEFYVSPAYTTTNQMRSTAQAYPAPEYSGRIIRICYDAEIESFTLKTPAGFGVTIP